jgi:hypothetical protein
MDPEQILELLRNIPDVSDCRHVHGIYDVNYDLGSGKSKIFVGVTIYDAGTSNQNHRYSVVARSKDGLREETGNPAASRNRPLG